MVKVKTGVSNTNSVSSSDDTDDSTMEKTVDTSSAPRNSNSKKKNAKKKEFLKRKRSDIDRSSDFEMDYRNVNTVKRVVGDTPSKINKKVKKNTKQEISSDNSSDEDVINQSFNTSNIRSPATTKIKMKKKSLDINELLKKDNTPIVKEESESDSNGQIYLHSIIKQENVSDDAEVDSEDSTKDHSSNRSTIQTVVKNEVQSDPNSEDAEDDTFSQPQPKQSRGAGNRSLTILQDIRLTPKARSVNDKLEEVYPGLKPMEITTELKISDSDEIHLFRIPKNVDPTSLKRVELDLEDECKVKLPEKYIITPVTKVPDPTLVISTNARVFQFKNNIKMETYVKSKHKPDIQIPENKSVPLPENLKKRHPLFGSDFQHKIKLNESVEKKLDEVIANLLKRERKAKKKKAKKHKQEETEPKQEIFDLFNSHNFLASHARIKKEASDDSAFGSSSSTDKPRLSKKKDKGHSSERNLEETDLPTEKTSSERKKEKKKKAKRQSQDLHDVSGIKKEVKDDDTSDPGEGTSTSAKKKMRKSIINSTLMPDVLNSPQFNSEVSTIEPEVSPRKKSKKNKKDSIKKEDLISQLLGEVTMQVNAPKKIKTEF